MGVHDTKTFKSGNSEAVRIPKEPAFGPGTAVTMERTGDTLTIRPVSNPEGERATLDCLFAELRAIGAPADGVQPRPDFEAPERPGLRRFPGAIDAETLTHQQGGDTGTLVEYRGK